mgnify:CR=1 FL=1
MTEPAPAERARGAGADAAVEGAGADAVEPLARLDRVSVRYAGTGTWVPQGVTLDLPAGTTTLLLGPSGCGKSTVTLTLNGLVPHSVPSDYRGSVLVAGQEVADADIAHLAGTVAMVMQDPDSQVVTTRVLDEVCYALENLRVPADRIEPRAMSALEAVGMGRFARASPWELSGGQRQRVVLAAALAVEPALLVLDEPTANLDPAGSADFYALLPVLKERGTAVLVVEHDLDELIGAIDHVIALDADGATIAVGPPDEVFGAHGRALAAAGIRLPTAVRLHQRLAARGLLEGAPLQGAGAPRVPLTLDDAARELAASRLGERSAAPPDQGAGEGPDGDGSAAAGPRRDEPGAVGARNRGPDVADFPGEGARDGGAGPVLVARGLRAARGRGRRRHEVLHDVSLTVERGQILAVVGVNGSGKSTLLRALAGLERWTAGEVSVAGRRRRPGRTGRAVTLVMQNPEHQFLERTVRDELAHGMRLEGDEEAAVERAVAGMLARFDLVDRAGANPFLLSGGQQRRLSVASVLGEHREAICLDEPTFGQDRRSAEALMARLHDVAADGAGLVIATHDMELAAEHADRVLVLAAGRVLAEGPAREVLADAPLLERAGLRPPALVALTRAAAALRATVPSCASWKELV